MTPRSSASVNPADGRGAWSSSFSISLQMRSDGRSSSAISAAQIARRRVERELESSGELHRAKHTQAVFAEGPEINRAQQLRADVGAPVEGIDVLSRSTDPRRSR